MLLNVVTTVALTIMLGFLITPVLRADNCQLDESSFGTRAQNVYEDDKEASNVLAENQQDEAFDEEDCKPNTEHLYSLDDDEDDFD